MGFRQKISGIIFVIGLITGLLMLITSSKKPDGGPLPVQPEKALKTAESPEATSTVIHSAAQTVAQPITQKVTAPEKIETIDQLKSFAKFDSASPDFIEKKWKVAKNLIAIPLKPGEKPKIDSLAHLQKLDLYKSENSFNDPRGKPVLIFPERNRLGFISGTLIIRLTDLSFEKPVIENHALKIEHTFNGISTLVARTDSMQELFQTRSNLLNDHRVQSIEVEVVEDKLERQ